MQAVRLFVAGLVAGLVGLVLVVLEIARVLADSTLGTVGTVLVWVGVGLVALGGLLLVLAVVRDAGPPPAAGQTADSQRTGDPSPA